MAVAMVTGASSGIGAAYAARLARDGVDLVLVARRGDRLEELARSPTSRQGVSVRSVVADLGQAQEVQQVAAMLRAEPFDLLVNNAGLAHYQPFVELAEWQARELVEVNALAPVLLSRAVLPAMVDRGAGSVVNVASLLAFSGSAQGRQLPQRAVYAATKSFLVTFSQILADEVAEHGVQVQVVCPGVVRTEFHTRQGMDLSQVPLMEPDRVVEASLADLDAGVVISIPALTDLTVIDRYHTASRALTAAAQATELPPRYAS